ncbi:DUF4292 domain-containing protein [Flavobacterium sp. 140616W15]|uniref:DUF4292 domain-containing protein n=1 Tax=Flavobacterium sp. 140616W15 TaxID=2478552 RepID=UPI000F0C8A93|nr:DUF4292 domain-containing protein [Flavobacterium sp. 140616W15]AYN05883.1 DUF4292 domain-containing protein [Flavobacterium sp. 140616W15]
MKKYLMILLLVFIVSCKSKSGAVQGNNNKEEVNLISANKIIDGHYNNKLQFSTLYIKASAKYSDDKQSQNVTAEIKIKKDEQILVSIRFLGITMAKALITPNSVSYYEKIGSSYYEGDFSSLSKWLGTDLDFNKVQNLLLGAAIDDLKKGKYIETLIDRVYRLDEAKETDIKKSFFFEADTFLLEKEQISQTSKNIMMQIAYGDNKTFDQGTLPRSIAIEAIQPKGKTEINLNYNTITFNEELSFPYSVPNGYKKIIIK